MKYINLTNIIPDVLSLFLEYFFFAGIFYFLLYALFKNKWLNNKIQKKFPQKKQILTEIKLSISSIVIFAFALIITHLLSKEGYTKLYFDIGERGIGYYILSNVFFIIWHDTYFYWSHVFLHRPLIFKRIHKQHHYSHNPTPWSSFAFHPLEAVIQTGYIFIFLIVPLHPSCLIIGNIFQIVFNVYGHSGYEFFTQKFRASFIGKILNTSTHHNMHHRFNKGNYGIYFNFWDKVMKTNHPEYEKYLDNKPQDLENTSSIS
jgi:lathosterol oxidase